MKDRRRKPSKGVVFFSWLLILMGSINFLSIVISFFELRLELQIKDHMPSLFHQFPYFSINITVFWVSTIISLVLMLCWIVSGVGMLVLKDWARQLLLISMGVYFLNKAIDVIINIAIIKEYSMQIPALHLFFGILFVLSLSISVTYFFTHPSVVKQFQKDKRYPH